MKNAGSAIDLACGSTHILVLECVHFKCDIFQLVVPYRYHPPSYKLRSYSFHSLSFSLENTRYIIFDLTFTFTENLGFLDHVDNCNAWILLEDIIISMSNSLCKVPSTNQSINQSISLSVYLCIQYNIFFLNCN